MFNAIRVLTLATAILATAAANAAILNFVAPLGLTGAQEVPPRATPATGTGTASFDTVSLLLDVHLTWVDLLAPAAAAHIHCCPGPGANGLVAVDFVPAGFPSTISGSFDHVFDLDDAVSYGGDFLASFGGDVDAARAAVVAGLSGGLAYFNIHTSVFLPGEIRGDIAQVAQVSEPGTLALIGLAMLLGFARRRSV
jgi:hypothetical protein